MTWSLSKFKKIGEQNKKILQNLWEESRDTLQLSPTPEKFHQLYSLLEDHYSKEQDPWGMNLETGKIYIKGAWPLYHHYFQVRVFGKENVADCPYIVSANHSGQIAFDGMLLAFSFFWDVYPPRILRGMVEKFIPTVPFLGKIFGQVGQVLGNRQNCKYLLERGESLMVFPEGVKGITKNTEDFYKLRPFTLGFYRMALRNGVDILPVAIVGAEEAYPLVHHARSLAKFFNLPAFPITPTFPWFGPLGLLPLPSPIDIHIGTPHKLPANLSPEAPDSEIRFHVREVENRIKDMIEVGLKMRRPSLGQGVLEIFNKGKLDK